MSYGWINVVHASLTLFLLWKTRDKEKHRDTAHTRLHLPDRTLINAPLGATKNLPSQYQPLEITTGESLLDQTLSTGVDKSEYRVYLQSYRADANTTSIRLQPNGGVTKTKHGITDNSSGDIQVPGMAITDTLQITAASIASANISKGTIPNLSVAETVYSQQLEVTSINATTLQTGTATIDTQNTHVVTHTSSGSPGIQSANVNNLYTTTVLNRINASVADVHTLNLSTQNATISSNLEGVIAYTSSADSVLVTTKTINATTTNVAGSISSVSWSSSRELRCTNTATTTLHTTSNATMSTADVASTLTTLTTDIKSGSFVLDSLLVNGINITLNGLIPPNLPIYSQVYTETTASGVTSGSAISGGWVTRTFSSTSSYGSLDPLYTTVNNGNITFQNGTYMLKVMAPGYNTFGLQARLIDTNTGTVEQYGTSSLSSGSQTNTFVELMISIPDGSSKTLSLQTACGISSVNGLGTPAGVGGATEVYAVAHIIRLEQIPLYSSADQIEISVVSVFDKMTTPSLTNANSATIHNVTSTTLAASNSTIANFQVTGQVSADSGDITNSASAGSLTVGGVPMGGLGTWQTYIQYYTVYQAATDLFIIVNAIPASPYNAAVTIYTDGSNPPSYARCQGGSGLNSGLYVSLTCMVRHGDYYEIEDASGSNHYPIYSIAL